MDNVHDVAFFVSSYFEIKAIKWTIEDLLWLLTHR